MRLLAIGRDDVAAVWPRVAWHLQKACRRSLGVLSVETLLRDCLSGHARLLVVADGPHVPAAAVASFQEQADGTLACSLDACGGAQLRAWRHVVPDFEEWARSQGAVLVRFTARPGWQDVFRGYRAMPLVCLSKDLRHA